MRTKTVDDDIHESDGNSQSESVDSAESESDDFEAAQRTPEETTKTEVESEPRQEYTCEQCNEVFSNRFALLAHSKVHIGKKAGRIAKQERNNALLERVQALELSKRESDARAKIAENDLKTLRASLERQQLQPRAQPQTSIQSAIAEIIQLQELSFLKNSATTIPSPNGDSVELAAMRERMQNMERQLREEKSERERNEREQAFKNEIVSQVNEEMRKHAESVNQKVASIPKNSDMISTALNNMTTVISKSQDNLSTLLRTFLTAPTRAVQGSTRNPQTDLLEKMGLIDRSTGQVSTQ